MKARAGFFTLLIALVSFAGFGFTTPDLSQNSEPTEIHQDAVVNVVAVIAVNQELQIESSFVMFSKQDVVKTDNLITENISLNFLPTNTINDVGKIRNYTILNKSAFYPKHFKAPRDGLNCSMT